MRFAVLGLYNSGSTALAGMLHRLGANMGPPFWENSDDNSAVNYYEPYDLSWHLRRWWNEPQIAERVSSSYRIEFLKRWVNLQECAGQAPVGAKHPLLSLCGPDLAEAWGQETLFFWIWRPLRESVAGLQRRGWFLGHEESIQQRLWDTLTDFAQPHSRVIRFEWERVRSNPLWAAQELARLTRLQPSHAQLQAAAEFVRVPSRSQCEDCGSLPDGTI